jgi:CheY-like chemotaxis protein
MADELKTAPSSNLLDVLKLLPQFLWILLAYYVASWVIIPTVEAARRGQGVELKMSEFTLEVVEQRLESARKISGTPLSVEDAQAAFGPLADRIERSRRQLSGATVLWVDDRHPVQNAFERRAIGALGVAIDTARSSAEALALLEQGLPYDAVVSDLNRPNQPSAACQKGSALGAQAGCELIARLRERCGDTMPPTIYTGSMQPDFGAPAHSFGMTNQVDKLMLLLLDAFERRPGPDGTATEDDGGNAGCKRSPLPPLQSGPSPGTAGSEQ